MDFPVSLAARSDKWNKKIPAKRAPIQSSFRVSSQGDYCEASKNISRDNTICFSQVRFHLQHIFCSISSNTRIVSLLEVINVRGSSPLERRQSAVHSELAPKGSCPAWCSQWWTLQQKLWERCRKGGLWSGSHPSMSRLPLALSARFTPPFRQNFDLQHKIHMLRKSAWYSFAICS